MRAARPLHPRYVLGCRPCVCRCRGCAAPSAMAATGHGFRQSATQSSARYEADAMSCFQRFGTLCERCERLLRAFIAGPLRHKIAKCVISSNLRQPITISVDDAVLVAPRHGLRSDACPYLFTHTCSWPIILSNPASYAHASGLGCGRDPPSITWVASSLPRAHVGGSHKSGNTGTAATNRCRAKRLRTCQSRVERWSGVCTLGSAPFHLANTACAQPANPQSTRQWAEPTQ